MSRLIKFRAWNKAFNMMCYNNENNTAEYWDGAYASDICMLNSILRTRNYELMQFTGFCDKNGREIYEGDILRGFTYPYLSDDTYNYIAEVVWFDDCAAFGIVTHKAKDSQVSGISDGNTDYMDFWNPNDWEVIGNIYENPELLGENYDS